MNHDDIIFERQYMLKSLVTIDSGFTHNITHDYDNNIASIVWIRSYVDDSFENFGNHLSVNVICSSVFNAKECCI